jgi:hypothetical protein
VRRSKWLARTHEELLASMQPDLPEPVVPALELEVNELTRPAVALYQVCGFAPQAIRVRSLPTRAQLPWRWPADLSSTDSP